MVKPLTIYKASAGSGKTFMLATEYIRLVVENPQSFRTILAVTFTNKATEEMKMRILSQLYGIWKDLPDSKSYINKVRESTGLPPEVVRDRAGMALHNLIRNYSDFRVMTIDTFFQGVLRNLARELDLTANLRIGLNDIQVEELAVDQIIESLKKNDEMLQWLMKYILENISDDKSWNVIGQIKQFGRTIFKDEYKGVSDRLQQKMGEPGFFDAYISQLRQIRQGALNTMKEIAGRFFEVLADNNLEIDDFSYGRSGVCSIFVKLREGTFDQSVETKRVANCLGNPTKWYKKSPPQKEAIHTLVETTLDPLLRQALEARPGQYRLYQSATLTLRHLNQLRLLESIEKKVRSLNEESNRFLLSDTQQLLHDLIDGSDSPFIFEKIGSQLEHMMIDEFQDTSTVQWENFKVLLVETMSHKHTSNLIVGDVKQSIYRWRSGDWRLLNDIQKQFPNPEQQLDILSLGKNYRSTANVIHFNNAFFQSASNLEYQSLSGWPEAEQLKKAYTDVAQEIPDGSDDSGFIDITLLPSENYHEATLQHLIDIVSDLRSRGIKPSSMAILVRMNVQIPLIAKYFMQYMPDVSIVSDEAFRLDASAAVCLLIESMRLLTRPDDLLTKAGIVKLYQREVLQNDIADDMMLICHDRFDSLLPDDYIQRFTTLRAMPLYELAEHLYALFGLERLEGQSAYVCGFFDRLADYLREYPSHIAAFLREWDETLCGKTIQSDEINGIRLISIHKSKGLEFDHVLIPFCDWQLEKPGNLLWCKPDEAPFDALPLAPIDCGQKLLQETIYEADYQHEHLQNTVDNLNLLYVAFTRASQSLFVLGKRGAKSSRSALVETALPLVMEDAHLKDAVLEGLTDEKAPLHFTFGLLPPQPREVSHRLSGNPFLKVPEPQPIKVATYQNKVEFRQSNQSRRFLTGDEQAQDKGYIQMGSILHEVFSTIHTKDDIDTALRRLELDGVLYDAENTSERITAMLRKRLEHPKVSDWFSGRYRLYNECTILSVEDGLVKEYRPDRVMTDGTGWIVVDFKFGTPKPEYEEQVRNYMALLSSMGHQHVSGFLWYVYSNKIIEVKS